MTRRSQSDGLEFDGMGGQLDATVRVHLATGLAVRDGMVLLVASRYPNLPHPLWNMPGGRQRHRELLRDTVVREVLEETSLRATIKHLAYVSESYDGDVHFTNTTFEIDVEGTLRVPQDDHIADAAWIPIDACSERIAVAVVRDPLVAYLAGRLPMRYAGFRDAGITIAFPDDV